MADVSQFQGGFMRNEDPKLAKIVDHKRLSAVSCQLSVGNCRVGVPTNNHGSTQEDTQLNCIQMSLSWWCGHQASGKVTRQSCLIAGS